MKIRHYLITAVVAYLTFLIYLAPAAPLLDLATKNNDGISIVSVTGSLWSGNARSLHIKNHKIENVHWSFIPWRLLIGEASYDIQAQYKDNPISTSIGLTLTGKYLLHNLSATLAAYPTGKILDIPIGELDGDLKIAVNEAIWSANTVPKITGDILWEKAAYIVAERAELGDVTIMFSESDTSPLIAAIKNTPDHLSIDGNITVNAEGHYDLVISLTPTKKASKNLRDSLRLIAKSLQDGSFEINNAGELSSLGLM